MTTGENKALAGYSILLMGAGIYLVFILGLAWQGEIAYWDKFHFLNTLGGVPGMLLIFLGGLGRFRGWAWYTGLAGVATVLCLPPLGTIWGIYGVWVLILSRSGVWAQMRRQLNECFDRCYVRCAAYLVEKLPPSLRELLRAISIFAVIWFCTAMYSGMMGDAGMMARGFVIVGPVWAVVYLALLLLPWVRQRSRALIIALVGSYVMTFVSTIVAIYYCPRDITSVARHELVGLRAALFQYRTNVDSHYYPATLSQLLQDDVPGWSGPYVVAIPPDPWNNQYQYESDGATYTIQTVGLQGKRWYRVLTRSSSPVILTVAGGRDGVMVP